MNYSIFTSPGMNFQPTNHLDLHALVWLEYWLVNHFSGMALIVSHDQVFLDSVATDILELKSTLAGQSTSSLTHYSGDFSTYTKTVQENKIAQERLRLSYEKEKEKLQEFISREGKKYDNPAHQAQVIYRFSLPLILCRFNEYENLIK
jgi:ATP-binding cassette subfamily F protein 2